MTTKAEQPQQLKPEDFNQIKVTFTDVQVQFIAAQLQRQQVLVQTAERVIAESLQHFAAMVAKQKNIQFDQEKFAGVHYDPDKKCAFLLTKKD